MLQKNQIKQTVKSAWLGSAIFAMATALAVLALILQQPMDAYASIDPGLDSGNATVDRTTVPGETILLYRTVGDSTFRAPSGVSDVRIMVIGGGGGGGSNGGGGGAGRMVSAPSVPVAPGTDYTVTVGGGGAGATPSNSGAANGGLSSIGSLAVAPGGGGGGSNTSNADGSGNNGGSGGGVGRDNTGGFTAGLGNQTGTVPSGGTSLGNNGGGSNCQTPVNWCGGSGGGGAGAVGGAGSGTNSEGAGEVGGVGGAGSANDITGSSITYAGGGGGGRHSAGTPGAGGSGGGGSGSVAGATAGSGAANTGSGGGGGGWQGTGGNGGSGIVVIRFTTQEAPDAGGVPGTAMWYKADSNGNTNSQWNDVNGFDNLTQSTAANQPTLTTNAMNFNPAYVFDGTDDVFNMPNNSIGPSDSMSAFYAANSTTTAGGDRYLNEFGDDRPSITIYNGKPRLYVRDTSSVDDQFSTIEAQQPRVYSFVSPNGGGTKVIGVDNREETKSITGSYTTGGGNANNKFGGRNVSAGTSWQGPIGEAIFFNRSLNAVERQKVNSYLAIKWGVTLGTGSIATDYYDSDTNTIWSADNTYKANIAGIGRDDTSTLNQKQSKSTADGSLVTIGHGDIAASNQANTNDFANDKTFMLWGHDAGVTDQATAVTNTSLMRMGRVWKAVVTNTTGPVKVQIPTSIITRSTASLLVSSSATFDDTSTQVDMSVNGANYEATTTLAPGTHYFTFASESGADLEFVSKEATDIAGNTITNYTPGQPIKYKLTVRNNGPDDADTLTMSDTLPDGIVPKPTGATGSGWDCSNVSGQTVTCTRPMLAGGATAPPIEIEADIASSVTGQKVNTANISSATNDPDNTNNSANVTLDAALVADLSLVKSDATVGTPVAGGTLDYKFDVTNNGPSDSPSYTINDTLPGDLTYASATPDICGSSSGQTIVCDGSSIANGDTQTVTVTTNVDAGYGGGNLTNTANVAVPGSVTDPNTANNTSTNNTDVEVEADLSISKTHTGDFTAGENETFTINVTNAGPSDVSGDNITVIDTLDEDFTFVSASGTNWTCDHNSGTVTCTYGAGLTSTSTTPDITLTVLVDSIADTPTDNTAKVASTTPDPDTSNNTDTDTVTIVAEADLALIKDHVDSEFTPGTNEQYTFSVTNNGPSADSPSYKITDTLPAGLTYVSSSGAADCSPSSGTNVECNGGAIGVGDPAQVTTITVAVDASATGSFNNNATVTVASGVTDPNTANNTDNDTVNIKPNADLAITKDPAPSFVAGDNADYTITVTNNGPSDVSGYTVKDTLDDNLTFVSSSPAICSASGQEVTCNGNAITNGNSEAITLTVALASTATSGVSIDNTATVETVVGENDPDSSNNNATTSNTVSTSADLAVAKTHTGNFSVGGNGSFTISATNNGPSDADTVTITDVLPAGLTYVSATSPDASCSNSGQTVTCSAGPTMSSGETIDITLDVTVNADVSVGTIDNTATVSSSTTDPNGANNSGTDTVTLDPAEADLETTKTLQGTMTAGEAATYRFEITNNGPDNAGAVTISDTLEPYLSYRNFTSVSGGTWDCGANEQDVTCTLPLLNNGDTAVVDVEVMVAQDAPDTADNSATVTFNGTDTSANNPATVDDPVSHVADLEVQLTHESETYYSGDTVEFTYTIINHGPSQAKNVVLTDTLPDGLTFENIVASAPSQNASFLASAVDTLLMTTPASAAPNTPFDCSNSGQDITCNASALNVGTYTITMTALINDDFTGNLAMSANIASATFDPNLDNNTATDTIVDVQPVPGGLAGVGHHLARTGRNIFPWLAGGVVLVVAAMMVVRYRRRLV